MSVALTGETKTLTVGVVEDEATAKVTEASAALLGSATDVAFTITDCVPLKEA